MEQDIMAQKDIFQEIDHTGFCGRKPFGNPGGGKGNTENPAPKPHVKLPVILAVGSDTVYGDVIVLQDILHKLDYITLQIKLSLNI